MVKQYSLYDKVKGLNPSKTLDVVVGDPNVAWSIILVMMRQTTIGIYLNKTVQT